MFRFLPHDQARQSPARPRRVPLGLLLAVLLCCSEAVQVGRNIGAGASSPSTGGEAGMSPVPAGGDSAGPDAAPPPRQPYECVTASCGRGTTLACGNCQDDDEDGLMDAADPDCLGPCDDSEDELFTGATPPINGQCATDCYFDRNPGRDDGCDWSYRCDPKAVGPTFSPTGLARCEYDETDTACDITPARVSACEANCLPLTPNGCDCFGCCELPSGSGNFIWLGSENLDLAHCELQTSEDEALCKPCTPAPHCKNECEECELCVGKPTLPSVCGLSGGSVVPLCQNGRAACDPENPTTCTGLEYCITGCCVPLPT